MDSELSLKVMLPPFLIPFSCWGCGGGCGFFSLPLSSPPLPRNCSCDSLHFWLTARRRDRGPTLLMKSWRVWLQVRDRRSFKCSCLLTLFSPPARPVLCSVISENHRPEAGAVPGECGGWFVESSGPGTNPPTHFVSAVPLMLHVCTSLAESAEKVEVLADVQAPTSRGMRCLFYMQCMKPPLGLKCFRLRGCLIRCRACR